MRAEGCSAEREGGNLRAASAAEAHQAGARKWQRADQVMGRAEARGRSSPCAAASPAAPSHAVSRAVALTRLEEANKSWPSRLFGAVSLSASNLSLPGSRRGTDDPSSMISPFARVISTWKKRDDWHSDQLTETSE